MNDELVAEHVAAIYGADLAEFTVERDRRVKELKAEGHKEAAKALKARRKPTVPAWTVDQLARRAPDDIEALLAAADELRTAQHRAASGRGAEGMREASRRLRDVVGDLRHRAARILEQAGTRPDAHLDEVEQTLFAAAVEPEHHDTLRRGTFTAVLPGPGFGGLGFGLSALPDLPDTDAAADDVHALDETADGLAAAAEAEQAEQERAEAERRDEAERLLASQRRALQRRIEALEAAREKQASRVERAREKADGLQARADAAMAEVDAARADLADYDTDLDAVRRELDDLTDDVST